MSECVCVFARMCVCVKQGAGSKVLLNNCTKTYLQSKQSKLINYLSFGQTRHLICCEDMLINMTDFLTHKSSMLLNIDYVAIFGRSPNTQPLPSIKCPVFIPTVESIRNFQILLPPQSCERNGRCIDQLHKKIN